MKKKKKLDLDHVQTELSQVFNLIMHVTDTLSELLREMSENNCQAKHRDLWTLTQRGYSLCQAGVLDIYKAGAEIDNIRGELDELNESFQGNGFELLDYTLEELKEHLNPLLKPGMTWDNYDNEWHVGHIISISHFNFTSPDDEDFKKYWALSNLQPEWGKENLDDEEKEDGKKISG